VPVRVIGGVAALVAVGAGLLLLVAPEQVSRALDEKAYIAGTNIDTRELRWQAAARMLAENPLLGVGPGGFRSEYAAASQVAEVAEQTPVAHSMYLEVGAELGLPGLVLFLGFAAAGLVASERALRTGADRSTVVAVQASLVAVLVASVFLSEQYYLPLWSLVAVACGLELRERKR
jgi:putative inorganic carbon (HCO3(-)) transporter